MSSSLLIVIDTSLFNLFIPGGLKNYKSKTIELTLLSLIFLWQAIDVITLLSVRLKKQRDNGKSSKLSPSSNDLT